MSALEETLHRLDQVQRERREDWERLALASSCLGSLRHLLRYPQAEDREARLAAAVRDLEAALLGDEVARAEVEAYRDDVVRGLLARRVEDGEQR